MKVRSAHRHAEPPELVDTDELAQMLAEDAGPPYVDRRRQVRRTGRRGARVALAVAGVAAVAVAAGVAVSAVVDDSRPTAALTATPRGGGQGNGLVYCPPSVLWGDDVYFRADLADVVSPADRLGSGVIPDCNDATSAAEVTGTETTVFAVEGVPPSVAVTRAGDTQAAYIGRGYFTVLAGFPLRPDDAKPVDELAGCSETETVRFTGTARIFPPQQLDVRLAEASDTLGRAGGALVRNVRVDSSTVVRMTDAHGVPHIRDGAAVTVTAERCLSGDGRGRLVARLIEGRA
jgi:hypothetical protein